MLDAHWPRRSYAMHKHLCHFGCVSLDTCNAFEVILSFIYQKQEQIDVRERVPNGMHLLCDSSQSYRTQNNIVVYGSCILDVARLIARQDAT